MASRATEIYPKDGEAVEIIATHAVVNQSLLVTYENELLDSIIIRHLSNGLPVAGRIKIVAERLD